MIERGERGHAETFFPRRTDVINLDADPTFQPR